MRSTGEGPALLDALDLPCALLDGAGTLLHANPALRRLTGPARRLAQGGALAAVLDAAARPAVTAALHQAARGSVAAPVEARLTAVGAQPPPLLRLWALPLPPGQVLLRIEDVTGAAEARAATEAEQRFALIGRVAGGIGHDFNNLLGVIAGGAADALATGAEGAVALDLHAIAAAASRGAGLVRSLLGAARQQVLLPKALSLAAVLTEAAPLFRRLLGPRTALELALAEARPVLIDPTQLDQVLLNLVTNARDAMPNGGRLRIALNEALVIRPEPVGQAVIPPGRWVTLTVQDTGPGIAPEVMPRLLEPFVTTRRATGGTGLGLATVQGIVAQSGGHLAVESPSGEGARFTLFFRRADAPAVPPPAATPADSPAAATPAPVLLVEDEGMLARLSERCLARAGHAVTVAEDAEAALALVSEGFAPGLVVSDVSLPGMDGLALVRALRVARPGLPAVLVSGYAAAALGADLGAEGIGFLAKPFAPAALVAACQEALSRTM